MFPSAASLQWHFGVSSDILIIYPWFLQYASLKCRHNFLHTRGDKYLPWVILAPWYHLLSDPHEFSLCVLQLVSPNQEAVRVLRPEVRSLSIVASLIFPRDSIIGVISFPVIRDRMDKIAYSHYSDSQTTSKQQLTDEFVFSFLRPDGARQPLMSHSNRSSGSERPIKQSLAPWVMRMPVLWINHHG